MQINQNTIVALREFGLTLYEIRIYVALLESGTLTASEISNTASVPYSKIYEVLRNLETKGWIESEQGRPAKYYAKPPDEAVETTKLRRDSLLKASEMQILNELIPLYQKRETQERPDIWIVRGEFNILAKLREMLAGSKMEILAAIPAFPEPVLNLVESTLILLKSQGVRISIMVCSTVGGKTVNRLRELGEIRLREQMFGGGIVCDMKQVLLLLEEGDEGHAELAIWADHVGLTRFARNYFEYLWQDAKEYPKLG